MYAKLVLRNAKRSVKDYLVYIVTMTICVMLFYSFLSISSNYYQLRRAGTRHLLGPEKKPQSHRALLRPRQRRHR